MVSELYYKIVIVLSIQRRFYVAEGFRDFDNIGNSVILIGMSPCSTLPGFGIFTNVSPKKSRNL